MSRHSRKSSQQADKRSSIRARRRRISMAFSLVSLGLVIAVGAGIAISRTRHGDSPMPAVAQPTAGTQATGAGTVEPLQATQSVSLSASSDAQFPTPATTALSVKPQTESPAPSEGRRCVAQSYPTFAAKFNQAIGSLNPAYTIKRPRSRPSIWIDDAYERATVRLYGDAETRKEVELLLWFEPGSDQLARVQLLAYNDYAAGKDCMTALLVAGGVASDVTAGKNMLEQIVVWELTESRLHPVYVRMKAGLLLGYDPMHMEDDFSFWMEAPSFVRNPNHSRKMEVRLPDLE